MCNRFKETVKDEKFKILKKKEIYEFLQGNGPELVTYNGVEYGMPYYTAAQLQSICVDFGMIEVPTGSRWVYVEALMDFVINQGRCDEFLGYFFSEERFDNLRSIQSMDEIDNIYRKIIDEGIRYINETIKMSKHELTYIDGHFHINEIGKKDVIVTPKFDIYTISYVQGLRERCNNELIAGNYDSVVTKSRTMMEEVLVKILEDNDVKGIPKGDLIKQYNQVKNLYGMQQSKEYDARINSLLGGLERIVQSVAEMRNANSDAHGVGSKRYAIRESEARLVMNSAITFCEYIVSDHGKKH